ncbi:acylpyruvate hydrolase [Paraburkholderia sp. GAS199]|uniref:fumarylacetoacetate hydrolase family protein n=1 Tax=Paraburkholderia sp. GAS199 TaxID=3035126 RepID=UPI003D223F28
MRFISFIRQGVAGIAVKNPDGQYRGFLQSDCAYPGDLASLLRAGPQELKSAGDLLVTQGTLFEADEISFAPPVSTPEKIICVGLNYADHSIEAGYQVPDYPTLFARFPHSLIGHEARIVKPRESDQLDYEGELVAVVGRAGRRIPKAEALSYIAGYTLFNDATLRDYQFRTPQWTMGKNFDATGAIGPEFVTADELPEGAAGLRIQTRLNGEIVQDANTSQMVFDVATLVALISDAMTLQPGDLIVTGTPSGIGMARTPQLWMKAGDVCEIDIERIGVLRNTVAAD